MDYSIQIKKPTAELQAYVESYQFIHLKGNGSTNMVQEDYPRTALDMVFTLNGAIHITSKNSQDIKLSKYAFVGLLDKRYEIKFSEDITAIHIRFKPNGIYPLTKMPLKQSWLQQISLDHLIGNEVDILYDNLGNESKTNNQLDLLEQFLLKKYSKANMHHRFNHCLSHIAKTKSNITVSQLATIANSNYKSLDRWFQKYIGTNPKKFLQLNRFKNILDKLENDPKTNWMDLVVDYGFHDQSHFVHQFKAIADRTPTAYIQRRSAALAS